MYLNCWNHWNWKSNFSSLLSLSFWTESWHSICAVPLFSLERMCVCKHQTKISHIIKVPLKTLFQSYPPPSWISVKASDYTSQRPDSHLTELVKLNQWLITWIHLRATKNNTSALQLTARCVLEEGGFEASLRRRTFFRFLWSVKGRGLLSHVTITR